MRLVALLAEIVLFSPLCLQGGFLLTFFDYMFIYEDCPLTIVDRHTVLAGARMAIPG